MEGESKPMEFDKIAAALAKAQAEMTNPPKTKSGQCRGGRYMYADLAEVLDHIRGPLSKNALAVVQIVTPGVLITRLIHSSGQYIDSNYPLPTTALDAQAMGSAITYARRYSVCALVGIAAEDDEDGAKATEAEQAAASAEESQKKEEARKRIEEMKAKGQLKSAYTGQVLKPGEEANPTPTPKPEPLKPADDLAPVPPPQPDGIDAKLKAAMDKDGITPDQLKTFAVKAGHLPAPGLSPANFPADYVEKLLKNWAKVTAHIKKESAK